MNPIRITILHFTSAIYVFDVDKFKSNMKTFLEKKLIFDNKFQKKSDKFSSDDESRRPGQRLPTSMLGNEVLYPNKEITELDGCSAGDDQGAVVRPVPAGSQCEEV